MRLLIFDMDGVLVDPTESFRRAVVETVRHFTDRETTFERIAEIKNEGGYNDDTDIALRLVDELGGKATRKEVEEVGHRLFWGKDCDGMILAERWLAGDGVLERLSERAKLAIFTWTRAEYGAAFVGAVLPGRRVRSGRDERHAVGSEAGPGWAAAYSRKTPGCGCRLRGRHR